MMQQQQLKKDPVSIRKSDSDGTGYETVPEIVNILCGTLENVASTNAVIIDTELEKYGTASEGGDSFDVSENEAMDRNSPSIA